MDVNSSCGSSAVTARRELVSTIGLALADFSTPVTGSVLSLTQPAGEGPQQTINSINQSVMISPVIWLQKQQ